MLGISLKDLFINVVWVLKGPEFVGMKTGVSRVFQQ